MIKDVIIKPIKRFSDDRGWLAETFRVDELDDFRPAMGYISATLPHQSRGPHEHTFQTDYFCFVGPGNFILKLWDNRKDSPSYKATYTAKVGKANPCVVIVPPGVVHGYKNYGDEIAYCSNFPDKLYAGWNKEYGVDEIRYEDMGSEFIL